MKNKPYTPGAVVNFFLDKSEKDKSPITPMKMQKLIYFAHGWNHAFYDSGLIDESIQAWEFGPVCTSVYHEYKDYGKSPIPSHRKMSELRLNESGTDYELKEHHISSSDKQTRLLLESIWKLYSPYNGIKLSEWTHFDDPENPWLIARDEHTNMHSVEINESHIKNYFKKIQSLGRGY